MLPAIVVWVPLLFCASGRLSSLQAGEAELNNRTEQVAGVQLYTVSRDGRLFRLEVTGNVWKKRLLAELGGAV